MLLLCILLSPLLPHGQVMTLFALLAAVSGQLLTMLSSLIHGGWQSLSGRYYSRVMPRAMNALMQVLYTVVMLPGGRSDRAGRRITGIVAAAQPQADAGMDHGGRCGARGRAAGRQRSGCSGRR